MPPIVLPEDTRGTELVHFTPRVVYGGSGTCVCVCVCIHTAVCIGRYINTVVHQTPWLQLRQCKVHFMPLLIWHFVLYSFPLHICKQTLAPTFGSASDIFCGFQISKRSIFLTQNSLSRIPQLPWLTYSTAIFRHICMRECKYTLNYWGHFWPFMFNFTVVLLILKGIVFPEHLFFIFFFAQSAKHFWSALIIETPLNIWASIYHIVHNKLAIQCCFES